MMVYGLALPDSQSYLHFSGNSFLPFFILIGEIGDWVNTFSMEQSRRFDDVYASKMAHSPLTFVWYKPGQETLLKSGVETDTEPLSCIS